MIRSAAIQIIQILLVSIGTAVMIGAQCVPASTAAGALDTCFGSGGKVTTDVTADRDFARAMAIQPDGKIVVAGIAGYSATVNNADFLIVRYNADGSLDTTFDTDGIVVTDHGPGTADDDYCRGVAIQPDGKIIVSGRSFVSPTTYALVVIRFNPDGSLDTTFHGDGRAQFELPAIIEQYAFALQPDGRIVVGGRSFSGGSFTGLLVRFNPDGSLDTSFGTNGATTASISGIFSIALRQDGKIVAAGTLGTDAAPAFAIARLNTNGALDRTFGTGGVATHHPSSADQTWFVNIRFDQQIFLGGHSTVQGDVLASLLRLELDGSLARAAIYGEENAFWNMGFQTDGKALTVGASHLPTSGFTIRRYTDVNEPDPTFNGGAAYVKFLPAAIPEAAGVNAIAMTRDNKIVVAGSVSEANNQTTGWKLAVTKLYSGLRPPHPERFDFDGDTKADVSIFRPSNGEWWHLRSSNDTAGAAQFGSEFDIPAPGDYTGDGKTDIAFWRPSTGEWFILRSEDFSYFAFPFGTNGDIPRPSDFDGDGKTDFIVYRPSQNLWYRINSIGLISIRQFGAAGDEPLIGDFDGDGRSDPAVFRPSAGEWRYQSSTNNATESVNWGLSTDTPVPSDFDGDGKTDAAVYRPSNGTWYIINSANGSFAIVTFGTAEDKPVPADYDGDGRSDIAVFRPSTGIWYLMRSTAGFAAFQFGISGDVPTPGAFVD